MHGYKHVLIHQDWAKKAKEMLGKNNCLWENSNFFGFLPSVLWLST